MKTRQKINNFTLNYDLSAYDDLDRCFFLDIETTGLSPKYSYIYMIGAAFYSEGQVDDPAGFNVIQWMAETPEEEATILQDFVATLQNYTTLIHYNGNSFDLPFIEKRCQVNGIDIDLSGYYGIDIYRRIFPYRHMLGVNSCKQKSIEDYLGINRIDEYNGGELIGVYKEYQKDHDSSKLSLLIQHNYDDIVGMTKILPVLSYVDMLDGEHISVSKVQANTYKNANDMTGRELLIHLELSSSLPKPMSYSHEGCILTARDREAIIKVPIYVEELKYFYEGYKDYYYLPEEDMAVHKSVAVYVDKDFRQQATAATCYTRKYGEYLPQWGPEFTPFFKREYESRLLYFELNDSLKKNKDAFKQYAIHVINMLVNAK